MLIKTFITFNQIIATLSVHMLQHLRGGAIYRGDIPTLTYRERSIIISNHQSRIDAFIIFGTLPLLTIIRFTPSRFMTAMKFYHSPLRPLLFSIGCYPTKKKAHDIIDYSVGLLRSGNNIMMFPEGRRTLREQSRPHSGITRLIVQTAADNPTIFLAHIEWSGQSWLKRRAVVTMQRAPRSLDLSDATAIMAAIYKL